MNLHKRLLEKRYEVFRKAVALKDLNGTTNSYVPGPRGMNRGKGLNDVIGRVKMARDIGATEEQIRDAILKGIPDPSKAIPERVKEVRRRFLS
jgi:hypothetical protein